MVTIASAADGPSVPASFLGFSFGYAETARFVVGDRAGGAWPAWKTVLDPLIREGFTEPVLRIGGTTGDSTYWNPGGASPPAASGRSPTIAVEPVTLQSFAAIHRESGVRFILGLNLAAAEPSLAQAEADAYRAAMPAGALLALELGNEPNLYGKNAPPDRPASYDYAAYVADVDRFFTTLAGNDFALSAACCAESWRADITRVVPRFRDRISVATLHYYPLSACDKSKLPSIDEAVPAILDEAASSEAIAPYAVWAGSVAAAGVGLRLAEMNSVACGGADGITDSFVQALWGADNLFEIAKAGIAGVNIHQGGTYATATHASSYAAFTIAEDGALSLRPFYLGVMLFALAAGHGGRFVPVTIESAAHLKVFAFRGADGALRVALIAKDQAQGAAVQLVPPAGSASAGSLFVLRAAGIREQHDVTFGGVGLELTAGETLATPTPMAVEAGASGAFDLSLAPGSAAVLVLDH